MIVIRQSYHVHNKNHEITPGNPPVPTATAIEPTPKASGGFSVPSTLFMPTI